ncbi:MAG: hypothetical protein ACREPF_00535 [Rhodanobacteraceae bacterium]
MNTNANTAFSSVPEVLLMLRAPGAGWLATLLAALDEASRDPDFSPHHRAVLARCLEEPAVPVAIVEAARERTVQFEATLSATIDADTERTAWRAAG